MSRPLKNGRPYQHHGLHTLKGALATLGAENRGAWIEGLGEPGRALREWRAALIADLGGEDATSAQQLAVIELAAKTYLFLESVDRYLLEQPSLVNKSRRQLFPIVLQRQQLADALARYMRDLGLERRTRELPAIADYLKAAGPAPLQREGAGPEPQGSPLRRAPLPPHDGEP